MNERYNNIEKLANDTTGLIGPGIDELIKPLVILLNYHGVETEMSCQGHKNYGLPYPWIDCNIEHLPQFISLMNDEINKFQIEFIWDDEFNLKISTFRIMPQSKTIKNGRKEFKKIEDYLLSKIN